MAVCRYFVQDVERSIAFYRDHLGFELREQWGPAFAIVGLGDLNLWLSGPGTSAAKPMPNGDVPASGGWNRIVVEVSELDVVVANLQATDAHFRNEIISGPGGRQVLVDDPDGNPIELFESRSEVIG
jgi:catechol 2,3-dioxygenase-like lactoylglutathione lyase family enzyme